MNEARCFVMHLVTRLFKRHAHLNFALLDQGLISASNFLAGIMLARGLGIQQFGQFSVAWIVVFFTQRLQQAVVIAPLMTLGPKEAPSEAPWYYGTLATLQLALTLACAIITILVGPIFSSVTGNFEFAALSLPLSGTIFGCHLQDFVRRYFFSAGAPGLGLLSSTIRFAAQIPILFWMLFIRDRSPSVGDALWIIAICAMASSSIAIPASARFRFSSRRIRRTIIRDFRFSVWLIPSALLQWLGRNVLVISAGSVLGARAVGALKAAQTLVGFAQILIQGLENVIPVTATNRFITGGTTALNKYLMRVAFYGCLFIFGLGTMLALNASQFLTLLFGSDYAEYGFLVRWYVVLFMAIMLALPLRFGLLTMSRTFPILTAHLIALLLSLCISLPLLHRYDTIAVMIGLITFQLAMIVYMVVAYIHVIRDAQT